MLKLLGTQSLLFLKFYSETVCNIMDDSGTSKEELSLSVEETNRLRASLGLRPLSVGSPSGAQSKATDRDAVAVENLKRYRAEESRTKKRMELSQKLQRYVSCCRTLGYSPSLKTS